MTHSTPEKTHALLEKLAEYVMNEVPRKDEVPTKQEMNAQFEQIERRLNGVEKDVQETKTDVKLILNGMDS